MAQESLFDEIPAPPPPAKVNGCSCSICGEDTPHIFKGERFCVPHHPNPGDYVRQRAELSA